MREMQNQTSPFLDLPAEVRGLIYEHALCEMGSRTLRERPIVKGLLVPTHASQPSLTRTCTLIRDEALPVFYSKNVFVCVIESAKALCSVRKWIPAVADRNVAQLQNIVVNGFDVMGSYRTMYKGPISFRLGVNLRSLTVTALYSGHGRRDEHLAWKCSMLKQMREEANGKAVTSKLLCKLLASFAQDYSDMEERFPRMHIDRGKSVFSSGLDETWDE